MVEDSAIPVLDEVLHLKANIVDDDLHIWAPLLQRCGCGLQAR
jgi:hypothetical protein